MKKKQQSTSKLVAIAAAAGALAAGAVIAAQSAIKSEKGQAGIAAVKTKAGEVKTGVQTKATAVKNAAVTKATAATSAVKGAAVGAVTKVKSMFSKTVIDAEECADFVDDEVAETVEEIVIDDTSATADTTEAADAE